VLRSHLKKIRFRLIQVFGGSMGIFLPLLSMIVALLIGALVLVFLKKNPLEAYRALFLGGFGTKAGIIETVVKSTPLLFVALGICVAYRGGVINIGGEGQLLMGAITTTVLGIYLTGLEGWQVISICLLGSMVSGAVWGGVAGFLKTRFGVNEILSTVMMNAIALQFSYYLLSGPLMDPNEIALRTFVMWSQRIPKDAWLPKLIPQTFVHTGALIAIILAILIYIFLWRTTHGYRVRSVGLNPDESKYAGINVPVYQILSLAIAGGLAGLAGGVEILGLHHQLMDGISGGYGYSGIVVALFGKLHPLGVIPASLLFGGLLVGGNSLQRAMQVPSFLITALIGLIILFVVSSDYFVNRQARRREMKNV